MLSHISSKDLGNRTRTKYVGNPRAADQEHCLQTPGAPISVYVYLSVDTILLNVQTCGWDENKISRVLRRRLMC